MSDTSRQSLTLSGHASPFWNSSNHPRVYAFPFSVPPPSLPNPPPQEARGPLNINSCGQDGHEECDGWLVQVKRNLRQVAPNETVQDEFLSPTYNSLGLEAAVESHRTFSCQQHCSLHQCTLPPDDQKIALSLSRANGVNVISPVVSFDSHRSLAPASVYTGTQEEDILPQLIGSSHPESDLDQVLGDNKSEAARQDPSRQQDIANNDDPGQSGSQYPKHEENWRFNPIVPEACGSQTSKESPSLPLLRSLSQNVVCQSKRLPIETITPRLPGCPYTQQRIERPTASRF